jgi:hypothetical protein
LVQDPKDLSIFSLYDLSSSVFPLGGLFELTSSIDGVVIPASIQRLEAFRAQISAINANLVKDENGQPLLPNTDITYSVYDVQLSSSSAVSAAINLYNANFTAVIGWSIK